MAHNPNRIKVAAYEALMRNQAEVAEWERETVRRELRFRVMATWNIALTSGWPTVFFPSVGTAIATGCHWLHVVCPACELVGEADLRKVRIHPDASIWAVVRMMSCQNCRPHPPFAKPLGVTRRSWTNKELWGPRHRPAPPPPVRFEPMEDIGWGQRQIQRAHGAIAQDNQGPDDDEDDDL